MTHQEDQDLKPTTELRGDRCFSYAMQVNKGWVMFLTCRLTMNEMIRVMINLKVKLEEPASRGRRTFFLRWHAVMTPR